MAYEPHKMPLEWASVLSSYDENEDIELPSRYHPALFSEFTRLGIAEPRSQRADYACSLHDGTRLHVHIMSTEYQGNGIYSFHCRYHIDKWDPAHSWRYRVAHVVTETYAVRTASVLGVLAYLGGM